MPGGRGTEEAKFDADGMALRMARNGRRREACMMMRGRGWVAIAAVVLTVLLAGLYVWRSTVARPIAASAPADASSDIGGPFKLVNQAGAPVDERVLRGKWSAVFFGYTFCPDVCPTTLASLGRASEALGDQASRFQVVYITVDPERDTPKVLGAYLASATFPKGATGLTGSPAQIAAVAKAYHVFYQKAPEGSTYTMDHTAVVYLMDPRGRFVRPLDVSVAPGQVAGQIREAMAAG
jgi:protein SCO1/2